MWHNYIDCEHKYVSYTSYTSAILSSFVINCLISFLLHVSTPLVELILTIDKIYKPFLTSWNESYLIWKNNVFSRLNWYRMASESSRLSILKLSISNTTRHVACSPMTDHINTDDLLHYGVWTIVHA